MTIPSYLDTTDGTTYYYAVSALNSAGESANSIQISEPSLLICLRPTRTVGNFKQWAGKVILESSGRGYKLYY